MNKIIEQGAVPRQTRGDNRAREASPQRNDPKRLRVQGEIQVIRTGVPLHPTSHSSKRIKSHPSEALALQPARKPAHFEALLIALTVADFKVHRILVDTRSSVKLLTWKAFSAMKIHSSNLKPGNFPLVGLADIEVPVTGHITLTCTFTDGTITRTEDADWVVVHIPLCYNGIMERPLIIETGMIIDLPKQPLIVENGKHPTVINGDKRTALEVHWNSKQNRAPTMVIGFPLEDHRGHDPRLAEPIIDFLLTKS
ncbi:hypothetical protein M5689_020790 [Euphorbia peplus]|nr:hypothetical protein M5689_020790 [Euphorbia peplus]